MHPYKRPTDQYLNSINTLETWSKSNRCKKNIPLKRTNVFEEMDDEVKAPIVRDPRKLKFMAAAKIGKSKERVEEESNTLRIENISTTFTQVKICRIFCAFGSIYSCRLVDNQNMAYIAFTKTESAKDAISNLNGKEFDGLAIKITYAPKILCNGQVLLEANQNDQMTGLPFNAQYENVSDGQKTRVMVQIPPHDTRKIIHQTIQLILKYGTDYETKLISREKGNPKYDFLTNFYSVEHAYYRWKVFSLKNGDLPNWWKFQPFIMFEGGSTWFPPKIPFEEQKPKYPESLEYDSAASESSDSGSDFEHRKKKKYPLKQTQLSFYHRTCFEDKLRNLTTYRGDIAEAMIFCMRHSYAAEELANLICDSLMINETEVYPTKVARLYLLSDILFNASSIPSAWKFRAAFEPQIPHIFAVFGKLSKCIPGLIRQDRFRAMITPTITAWERWAIFPSDYTDRLWLSYKTCSVEGLSLESRLKIQQENKIGLYSYDYESKEKSICGDTTQLVRDPSADILPEGFKKTDSWISIDDDADSNMPVYAEAYDQYEKQDRSRKKSDESDEEDLDGCPLIISKTSFANRNLDGRPLHYTEESDGKSDDDLDGQPSSKEDGDQEEDLDGQPLFRFH